MMCKLRLSMLLLLSTIVATTSAEEYSFEFTKKKLNDEGTVRLGNVTWNIQAPEADFWGWQSERGQQVGSAKRPVKSLTLSTTDIRGKVSKIVVETSGARGTGATLEVKVGGKTFGQVYNLTNTSTEAVFTGNATGEIKLCYDTRENGKALYIKSIKIVYGKDDTPVDIPKKIVSVKSIAEFNALPDGEEATLYLSDEAQARVTYVQGKDAYLRDGTAAVCFHDIDKAPAMAYNQHVAGYITGKKSSLGKMPALVATKHTNTARLIIANPVTEPNTEPVVITAAEQTSHYADWVTIKEVTMGDEKQGEDATGKVKVVNAFATKQYAGVQSGKKYDLSGIVTTCEDGDPCLSPIYNVAGERIGNPAAGSLKAEFMPLTLSTGIELLNADNMGENTIYDLLGRRVAPTKVGKGIYIMNGKKIVRNAPGITPSK